jgi:hypothetical protein
MTDPELIDLLQKHDRMTWRVSISRAGTFLIIAGAHYEITDKQAEILWNLMRGELAARRSTSQPEMQTTDKP